MNTVCLVGNLTRDPELRTTQNGISTCSFTVAVNRRKSADGVQRADFIQIVTWRTQAENCARYLAKGRKVAIVGMIQTRTYDAQDGTKRYVTEVVANEVTFLPSGSGANASGGGRGYQKQATQQEAQQVGGGYDQEPQMDGYGEVGDDELPF